MFFVIRRVHCCLLIFQGVDLLFQVLLLCEQSAFGRIVGCLLICAKAQQGEARQKQTLSVSGSGRYVRMNGTQRATPYGYSLWEFQVLGT